ncbi:hypothetical protein [Mariprofundus sp. KV]|uniref:hypothetical protein n=1 Tax=Mariprofundus sp. KV TaxID=2608715 RepID=UPI0015A2335F|nr:hypothetical protein [Mariprofundus sp. KV]NWF35443.1 hypothetical protein [Mariprofundus sp. KV]
MSHSEKTTYANADQWRAAAMARSLTIPAEISEQRQQAAACHNIQEGVTDSDTLLDQQLYIRGKMELDEYQEYLLFKHGQAG